MAETAIYIILTFCGFLIGVVSTLLMVVFRMNTKITKVEANQENLMTWVPKISESVDRVITQSTTLIAELQACHKR
jgi:hypothetical protein